MHKKLIWDPVVHTCLMVRGGSLLILRFVGQRSRLQPLKIEQKFDTFFCFRTISQVQETKYTHVERNKSHELEVCGSKVKITFSKNRTVI